MYTDNARKNSHARHYETCAWEGCGESFLSRSYRPTQYCPCHRQEAARARRERFNESHRVQEGARGTWYIDYDPEGDFNGQGWNAKDVYYACIHGGLAAGTRLAHKSALYTIISGGLLQDDLGMVWRIECNGLLYACSKSVSKILNHRRTAQAKEKEHALA